MLRLNEPVQVRAAAALALGQIGDEIAFDALSEALKDPSPYVRYASALSLGSLEVDGVTTRLERVLRRDAAWQPRYAAAISIGRTRKSFAIPSLTQALRHDLAWQVRQQAARSLQDIGTPAAAQSLASALADPEPSVRAAAGAALMEIGGLEDRRAVSDALRIENNPSVRTVWSNAQRRFLSKP
jgi:HEAT repeat protein